MEQFFSLLTLQAQLALLMIIGIWFSQKGIINDQGRKCLTDLVIDIILPCNILQSFRIDLTLDMLRSALSILIVSIVLQLFYGVFCAAAYNLLLHPQGRAPVWHGLHQRRFPGQRHHGGHLWC